MVARRERVRIGGGCWFRTPFSGAVDGVIMCAAFGYFKVPVWQ